MKELECPLCKEKIYSSIGEGCKMCAMPLNEWDEEFCSKRCKIKYFMINKLNNKVVIKI